MGTACSSTGGDDGIIVVTARLPSRSSEFKTFGRHNVFVCIDWIHSQVQNGTPVSSARLERATLQAASGGSAAAVDGPGGVGALTPSARTAGIVARAMRDSPVAVASLAASPATATMHGASGILRTPPRGMSPRETRPSPLSLGVAGRSSRTPSPMTSPATATAGGVSSSASSHALSSSLPPRPERMRGASVGDSDADDATIRSGEHAGAGAGHDDQGSRLRPVGAPRPGSPPPPSFQEGVGMGDIPAGSSRRSPFSAAAQSDSSARGFAFHSSRPSAIAGVRDQRRLPTRSPGRGSTNTHGPSVPSDAGRASPTLGRKLLTAASAEARLAPVDRDKLSASLASLPAKDAMMTTQALRLARFSSASLPRTRTSEALKYDNDSHRAHVSHGLEAARSDGTPGSRRSSSVAESVSGSDGYVLASPRDKDPTTRVAVEPDSKGTPHGEHIVEDRLAEVAETRRLMLQRGGDWIRMPNSLPRGVAVRRGMYVEQQAEADTDSGSQKPTKGQPGSGSGKESPCSDAALERRAHGVCWVHLEELQGAGLTFKRLLSPLTINRSIPKGAEYSVREMRAVVDAFTEANRSTSGSLTVNELDEWLRSASVPMAGTTHAQNQELPEWPDMGKPLTSSIFFPMTLRLVKATRERELSPEEFAVYVFAICTLPDADLTYFCFLSVAERVPDPAAGRAGPGRQHDGGRGGTRRSSDSHASSSTAAVPAINVNELRARCPELGEIPGPGADTSGSIHNLALLKELGALFHSRLAQFSEAETAADSVLCSLAEFEAICKKNCLVLAAVLAARTLLRRKILGEAFWKARAATALAAEEERVASRRRSRLEGLVQSNPGNRSNYLEVRQDIIPVARVAALRRESWADEPAPSALLGKAPSKLAATRLVRRATLNPEELPGRFSARRLAPRVRVRSNLAPRLGRHESHGAATRGAAGDGKESRNAPSRKAHSFHMRGISATDSAELTDAAMGARKSVGSSDGDSDTLAVVDGDESVTSDKAREEARVTSPVKSKPMSLGSDPGGGEQLERRPSRDSDSVASDDLPSVSSGDECVPQRSGDAAPREAPHRLEGGDDGSMVRVDLSDARTSHSFSLDATGASRGDADALEGWGGRARRGPRAKTLRVNHAGAANMMPGLFRATGKSGKDEEFGAVGLGNAGLALLGSPSPIGVANNKNKRTHFNFDETSASNGRRRPDGGGRQTEAGAGGMTYRRPQRARRIVSKPPFMESLRRLREVDDEGV